MTSGNFLIKSPAKINLFLKIVGKNCNYHNLESVLAFIDLFDEIEINFSTKISSKPNIKISFSGIDVKYINSENNIISDIFDFFCKKFVINYDFEVNINKKIPVGAGLGGGSSNGANFMILLNKICQLGLTKNQLQEISFEFGSDLAFFFEKKASIIRDRGFIDDHYNNIKESYFILVKPDIFISTKTIFNNFDGEFTKKISNKEINSIDFENLIKKQPNQLEEIVILNYQKIKLFKDFLLKYDEILSKMTGSGSSFMIFVEENRIDYFLNLFTKEFPDFYIRKCKILEKWQQNLLD